MSALSLRKDSPPFRRVLVANRGEIALRIMGACRDLGSETVAVYSAADSDALHVSAADRAIAIGPAPAAESYLSVDRIIEAARATDADAIHPGYGFLSERPELARECAAAGITFIGPSPETLASLGDKIAARSAAARAGVPTVPGTPGPLRLEGDDADRALMAAADTVGLPILIKAAAGGGGRGMRRVDSMGELLEAAKAASREAAAAFGDGSVYLERLVEGARHVEVQLLGDTQGTVVALGERDCSVQRRHQKLVEEAPAPGLSAAQRASLHALAVRVAETVGLRNAATAEFLMTPAGEFWFLEVNARLQVEHGVTEMVTGIDLVHQQLRIAVGEPLSDTVRAAADVAAEPVRHAIEARISAEDPARDFMPVPGRLGRWQEPDGPGIRVDSGVRSGSVVSPYYDPLLAKVMAVGADRAAAVSLLRAALDELMVTGLQTTLPFHLWLLTEPAFTGPDGLATDLVERLWRPEALTADAARRAAQAALEQTRAAFADPGGELQSMPGTTWWRRGVEEATGGLT